MSIYRYQAVILFPSYPSVVTIEARNDREALAKLLKMAEGKKLLKETITREGMNLQEHYRAKQSKTPRTPAPRRKTPRK